MSEYPFNLVGRWIGYWNPLIDDPENPTEYRAMKVLKVEEGEAALGLSGDVATGIDAATGRLVTASLALVADIQPVDESRELYMVSRWEVRGDWSPTIFDSIPRGAEFIDIVEIDLPHPFARMMREAFNTIERIRRAAGLKPGPWYFIDQVEPPQGKKQRKRAKRK